MKRTALILLISGFWLLVSGFFTHIHAQDETLTLLTYYPAPYGVYRELKITAGTSGDAILTIEADTDDGYENDNPQIRFLQDGGNVTALIALVGDSGTFSTGTLQNALLIGSEDNNPAVQFVTNDNVRMTIRTNGKVGIGTVNPNSLLQISSGITGDSVVTIEADTDNNDENDNPAISFLQDGGAANAFIGLEGNAGIRSTGTLGNALVIGSEDNDPAVQFVTNDNVRMTILTNGDVGIGTNNPTIKFAVAGGAIGLDNDQNLMAKQSNGTYSNLIGLGTDDNTYVNIAPGAHPYGGLRIWNKGGNERSLMKILPSGKIVMYGTSGTDTISSPQSTLSLHGTAAKSAAGDWAAISDIRLKENIQPINNALDKMIQLRGITFQWKEPEKHGNQTGSYMGMTAQDVEGVFPEWVGEFDEGYKTLCFIGFEALATEAIKELKAENDALKTKNAELESRIKTLEDKIISK